MAKKLRRLVVDGDYQAWGASLALCVGTSGARTLVVAHGVWVSHMNCDCECSVSIYGYSTRRQVAVGLGNNVHKRW